MTLILNGTDNSATTPAVTGTDTDTGVYYPAANQVALATNGTFAMIVNASQNVGIGTNNPSIAAGARLVVQTPTSTVSQFAIDNVSFATGQTIGIDFTVSGGSRQAFVQSIIENGTTAATALTFGTASGGNNVAERVRIDSTGNQLVNLTSNSGYTARTIPKAYINAGNDTATVLCGLTLINQGNAGAAGYGVGLRFNMSTGEPGKFCQIAATADGSFANSMGLAFYTTGNAAAGADNVTQRMYIGGGGSIGAPSGTNIYNASDERLKKNIQPLTGNLAKINSLEPVSFNWIENFCKEENDKVLYGFVAQRTQPVDSNLVEHFGASSNVTIDAGTDKEVVVDSPLRVNEKFIIPMLVGAIQELKAEFDAYKASHP
jgi:hypothetical protein